MNTIPLDLERTIFGFLDANTLHGINRTATQIARARRAHAVNIIQRSFQRHHLIKRWFETYCNVVESSESLNRFAHKRFYPLKYRLGMMRLALKKVLRDHDDLRSRVRILIHDTDRPIVDRHNDYVDLLSHEMLLCNGW